MFAAKVLVEMLGIVGVEVCIEGAISSTNPLNF